MLRVADVEKSYGEVHALRGVSLDVEAGSIVVLLGPNGAGKTTLISTIAGLLRPDRGTVEIGGVDVLAQPSLARRHLGLAPQELGVYPSVSVAQNLRFFGRLAGLRRAELAARVDEVADAMGLTALMDRHVNTLSGGEKRRVHTAVALLHKPQLLLLDEPTVGADVETRLRLLDAVRAAADHGAAILYSTHYLGEIESLRATVALLCEGELVARGSMSELIAEHSNAHVEMRFDGEVADVRLDGGRVEVDGSVVRLFTDCPGTAVAGVLAALGSRAARLASVEIVPPNLEAAFLALTGRRLTDANGHDDTAAGHAIAS